MIFRILNRLIVMCMHFCSEMAIVISKSNKSYLKLYITRLFFSSFFLVIEKFQLLRYTLCAKLSWGKKSNFNILLHEYGFFPMCNQCWFRSVYKSVLSDQNLAFVYSDSSIYFRPVSEKCRSWSYCIYVQSELVLLLLCMGCKE